MTVTSMMSCSGASHPLGEANSQEGVEYGTRCHATSDVSMTPLFFCARVCHNTPISCERPRGGNRRLDHLGDAASLA